MRFLLTLLLLAPFAVGQAPPSKPAPAPPAEPPVIPSLTPPVKDGKVTYPLTLSPAVAPKPLSDFYLEAGYGEKQPGEKLGGFLKCFMEQDFFYNQENQMKREVWLGTPLDDLPADVRTQAGVNGGIAYKDPKYTTMMGFADQAARYTRTEWNEYFNLRKDAIYFLLPEVQKLRALARAVYLRLRGEIKAGEFDKAVVSVRTLFGLTRMLETHPTLIGNLVGMAVASMALDALQEMVSRPGCPNLYWSFADLPTPLVSLREGLGGERVFLAAQFGKTIPADRALSDKEVAAVLQTIAELQGMAGEGPTNPLQKPAVRYAALSADDKLLTAARDRLTAAGTPADVVKAMPKLQLVMLEDVARYDVTRDEIFKWVNRPHPEALAGLKGMEEAIKKEKQSGWVLGPLFLPSVSKVTTVQAKLDQRVAYLMTIEAIRLYASENGGKLPEKLADIKVTVPADPISGKPFEYGVKDGVATLTGKNPSGMESDNRVYELRLRK